ncbi:ATP-grasp domain-containing protein [Photorhabdus viridis]|uniref:ATP-grasp domain-containing protein n=1 Tax=Photorhabdus viridis TaxID=3163327 RepID=UPI003306A288
MIIFFGGNRDILSFYIKSKRKIIWFLHNNWDRKDDVLIYNCDKYLLDDLDVDRCIPIIEKYNIKGAKCVSYHDNYHELSKSIANHFSIESNYNSNANMISMNKELARNVSNKYFDLDVKYTLSNGLISKSKCCSLKEYNFPLIIKPRNGTASKDVRIIYSYKELISNLPLNLNFLIEEYIPGKEFSVEVASFNGKHKVLMISEKTLFPDTFIAKTHTTGTILCQKIWNRAESIISKYLNEIGYSNGISHVEIKYNMGLISFIECQHRMGGGFLTNAYNYLTGDSISEIAYNIDTDENFDFNKIKTTKDINDVVYIEFFHLYIPGSEIVSLNEIKCLDKKYGILKIGYKENDLFQHNLKDGFDRDIHIIIYVNTFEDIKNYREKAVRLIDPIVSIKISGE